MLENFVWWWKTVIIKKVSLPCHLAIKNDFFIVQVSFKKQLFSHGDSLWNCRKSVKSTSVPLTLALVALHALCRKLEFPAKGPGVPCGGFQQCLLFPSHVVPHFVWVEHSFRKSSDREDSTTCLFVWLGARYCRASVKNFACCVHGGSVRLLCVELKLCVFIALISL